MYLIRYIIGGYPYLIHTSAGVLIIVQICVTLVFLQNHKCGHWEFSIRVEWEPILLYCCICVFLAVNLNVILLLIIDACQIFTDDVEFKIYGVICVTVENPHNRIRW